MNFVTNKKRRLSAKEKRRKIGESSAFADLPAIDEHSLGSALNIPQVIAIENGDIRVLAHFQRADAVGNADHMGGIDGDGPPGGFFLHARFDRQTSAQGQIIQRNDRRVSDDADFQPRIIQNAGCGKALLSQLHLGLGAKGGAYQHRLARLDQMIHDQVSLGHMIPV